MGWVHFVGTTFCTKNQKRPSNPLILLCADLAHPRKLSKKSEIVSKVILRHANLSTTERYLGKISDVEAMKWIDNLYG